MNTQDQALLDGFLDGGLSEDDLARLKQMIQSDTALRRALAEELRFRGLAYCSQTRSGLEANIDSAIGGLNPEGHEDSILRAIQADQRPGMRMPGRSWRPLAAGIAAAVLIAAGVVWMTRSDGKRPPTVIRNPIPVQLAAGWKIQPSGTPTYAVLAPDLIRLDQGELLVESDGEATRPPIRIETPEGTATASGRKFLVATYPSTSYPTNGSNMLKLTRILVLAGMVTLANGHGSITGQTNEILAAETGQPPMNHAVKANGDFAFELYKQLAKENDGKNLFFSPYSMSTALAMTAEGARGETAEQMGKVLHFPPAARPIGAGSDLLPMNTMAIHTGMKDLHDRFNPKPVKPELRAKMAELRKQHDAYKRKADEQGGFLTTEREIAAEQKLARQIDELAAQFSPVELRTANALWGEKSYPFAQPYLDTIGKFYGTGAANAVDFRNNHNGVREQINGWVEEQTEKRITNLLPPNSVDGDTSLVLTNAIYFKGAWEVPFDKNRTQPEDFLATTGPVQVQMMQHYGFSAGRYGAFHADGSAYATPKQVKMDDEKTYVPENGVLVAELPYKGGELSMVLLVPVSEKGLAGVEAGLDGERLEKWCSQLQRRTIILQLPKFKMDSAYDMKSTLQAMGMTRAFVNPAGSQKGAQFDGMTNTQDPAQKLYISQVLHKGFIEVNETGTEAAAATAVVMSRAGGVPRERPYVPTVRADRPFVYLIRDAKTGAVLFLGRVTDPTK